MVHSQPVNPSCFASAFFPQPRRGKRSDLYLAGRNRFLKGIFTVDSVTFAILTAAYVDSAILRSHLFWFWLPKALVGSKGCVAGYAEHSVGHILMRIPCAEMWLRPAGEGEMYYQLNVFFLLPVACVSFVMCLLGCRAEVLIGTSLMLLILLCVC